MKQRFYFDTSVFGGVFDAGFDEASILLFDKVRLGEVVCVYSDLTEGELFQLQNGYGAFLKTFPQKGWR